MYAFEARLPIDHVLAAIRLVRAGDPPRGQLLKLAGAAVGEIGALLEKGPIFSVMEDSDTEVEIDAAIKELESLEFSANTADPNFNPLPYIPIMIAIIQWIMSRRKS
jgi:hypothetical protein